MFWTRVGVQVVLFLLGLVIALAILLGNLWLAGRLVPPSTGEGGTIKGWIDRLNEAAANADRTRQRGPWDPWGGARGQDGGLGPEHGVDGLHGDARLGGHRLKRRRGVAVLEESTARGVDDAPTRHSRPLLAQRRASSRRLVVDRCHVDRVYLYWNRVQLYQ